MWLNFHARVAEEKKAKQCKYLDILNYQLK